MRSCSAAMPPTVADASPRVCSFARSCCGRSSSFRMRGASRSSATGSCSRRPRPAAGPRSPTSSPTTEGFQRASLQGVRHLSAVRAALPLRRGLRRRRQQPAADARVPAQRPRARAHPLPRRRHADAVRRRARRPPLLLRHRRRDPRAGAGGTRHFAELRPQFDVPDRPRLSDALGAQRTRRALRRARRVAVPRRRGPLGLRLRGSRALPDARRPLSRSLHRVALGVSAASAGPGPVRRGRPAALSRDRVSADAGDELSRARRQVAADAQRLRAAWAW